MLILRLQVLFSDEPPIVTDKLQVISRLKKVNEALKKFKHVNKKAFEQYNSFTTQRDSLTKRRVELDKAQDSIKELVEVLDTRKDEAIERTFKQVSKEFASIFERLVPAGRGKLIIQRKMDKRVREEEDSDEEPREAVENYTGVGISVSFNSKHDEQQRIQQLSGGQKSKFYLVSPISLPNKPQVFAPLPSFSLSNNATPHLSTSSTKSTPISTPNTVPPSRKCSKRSRSSRALKTTKTALVV